MKEVSYYSTNNKSERVNFETALLNGMASNYGLYMMARSDIPKFSMAEIGDMKDMSYAEIAFKVLSLFLGSEIPTSILKELLDDAYNPEIIPTKVENVVGKTSIIWLTNGPTASFKDYAARFFGRSLNYFLGKKGLKRTVLVATSGDTGGAVADALYGLNNMNNIVFFPKGEVSEGQRRQMTTLLGNVYAFEVNGDFDVCQALAKTLLGDKTFATETFGDKDHFTSANSISIGRLLPQAVYPFFAYSKVAENGESVIMSVPSGNFGDIMGTVIAREMGLPIAKILCGVNENTEFSNFLKIGKYEVTSTKKSPSSAMNVSHPSNLARLIDFYGGHMHDERDPKTKKVVREGIIDKMPDLENMRKEIFSKSISDSEHYETMKKVYEEFGIILDPHGAVGWKILDDYLHGRNETASVVYETADPGKFPKDVKKAIGITPPLPKGMQKQAKSHERIYFIESESEKTPKGIKLSDSQIKEAKEKIAGIFN